MVEDGVKSFVSGVVDGARYLANSSKKLAIYGLVGAVALTAGARIAGAHEDGPSGTAIHSFRDFNPSAPVKYVGMPVGTNLEILESDPPASIVESGSYWHMGFINYIPNEADPNILEAQVVGHADNGLRNSSGWEGLIYGNYFELLGDGNTPEDVWIVHDVNKDGMGTATNGTWNMGADDKIYYSGDVMFGPTKVYGDVTQLPAYVTSGPINPIPAMEVDDRPVRTDPAGMNELLDLTENWLSQECHPYNNVDCNGTDWDLDGDVDFVDFSRMAQGWDPGYVAPMSASSSSPLESSAMLGSAEVYSTVQDESGVYVAGEVESKAPYVGEPNSSYLIKAIRQGDEVIAEFGE